MASRRWKRRRMTRCAAARRAARPRHRPRNPLRMAASDLVLAMTGASGAAYGVRLLDVLLAAGRTVHLVISPAGSEVILQELDRKIRLDEFRLADLSPSATNATNVHYHD